MTVREIHNEMHNLDIEQLQHVIKLAHIEIVDRLEQQRNELIENFLNAFNNLKENNIIPSYTNDNQEETLYLENQNNFDFKLSYTDNEPEELYFEN